MCGEVRQCVSNARRCEWYTDKGGPSVNQLNEERTGSGTDLEWDKDVDPHLDFVTAATNLRAHIFNIALQSRFTVKGEHSTIW